MEKEKKQKYVERGYKYLNKIIIQYAKNEGKMVGDLDKDDVQYCMFEAILQIRSPAQAILTHNERHEIVDHWYNVYPYISLTSEELKELNILKEYCRYLNGEGTQRLVQLWTRKDKEDQI